MVRHTFGVHKTSAAGVVEEQSKEGLDIDAELSQEGIESEETQREKRCPYEDECWKSIGV